MTNRRVERLDNSLSQLNRMRISKDILATIKYLPSDTAKKVMAAMDIINDAQADVLRRINKNINN